MVAGASNTTQTASPRRNTAAPAGLAQAKLNCTCALSSLDAMWRTPPAGIGLGRGGSGGGALAAASWAAVGGTFWKTLTNIAPSDEPTL
jgi:hypothetical protein